MSWLPRSAQLFDLFRGPGFTLLGVGYRLPPVPASVRSHRIHDRAARETYGRGLFLVRPDGYIGLATHDLADVHAYLATVGPAMREVVRVPAGR